MKTFIPLALIALGAASTGFSSQAKPVNQEKPTFSRLKFEVRLKGVDEKWFSGLQPGVIDSLKKEDGTIVLPSVIPNVGLPASIEVIQQYSTRLGAAVVPCGLTFTFNHGFDGEKIHLSGNSVLRYPTDAKDHSTASQFITQENLLDMELKQGETQTIDLEGGGKMLITVTMLNAKGEPIKE